MKFLEIERKYSSKLSEWDLFTSICKRLKPIKRKLVEGFDTYYKNEDKVLRWRNGSDLAQLTIKSRYNKHSSLVREELEINIDNNTEKEVISFIKGLGFKKLFRIKKTCEIFWFKDKLGEVCIVIYKVLCKKHKDRIFIEIEAEKGISVKNSKKLVKKWEDKFEFLKYRRLHKTLYEIYSGKDTYLKLEG
jgi:adenylate cyclase class IV